MTTTTLTRDDIRRSAVTLLASYNRLQAAVRPIDKKVATAEFDGMCRIISALHIARTPTAVYIAVMEAATEGVRPGYQPNNAGQQRYDAQVAVRLTDALQGLSSNG